MKKNLTLLISFILILTFGGFAQNSPTDDCPPVKNLTIEYTNDCDARLIWDQPGGKSILMPVVPVSYERNMQWVDPVYAGRGAKNVTSKTNRVENLLSPIRGGNSNIVLKMHHGNDGPDIYKATLSSFPGIYLGYSNFSLQAMEYINGEIYCVNYASGNAFGKIDANTGAWTLIKSNCGYDAVSLCFNPTNGLTYITSWQGGAFGTVDLVSGNFTSIAQMPQGGDYTFFTAIDNDGVAYAIRNSPSPLDDTDFGTINLANGDFSFIAKTPYCPAGIQSLEVDRETNELYWLAHRAGSDPTVYKVSKTNGALTPVAYLPFSVESSAILTSPPDNCDPVTNLEYSVENNDVTLTWTAAPGSPTGYEISFDGTPLTTITETTYTHTNVPNGVHIYTVTALFSGSCIPLGVLKTVIVGDYCQFRIEMADSNISDGHPMGWSDDGQEPYSHIAIIYGGEIIHTCQVPYDAAVATSYPYLPVGELQFEWVSENYYDALRSFKIYNSNDDLIFEQSSPTSGVFLTYENDCSGTGPKIYLYNVYRDGDIIIQNLTARTYTDTDFDISKSHEWSVEVVCEDGGVSSKVTEGLDVCKNSVNDINNIDFSIVPNPATDKITILSKGNLNKIEVINFLGQTVFSQSLSGNESTLNISTFNSGIYFVRVTTDNGTNVQKFVKK